MKTFTRVMLALIAGIAALLVLVPATTASAALQFTTSQDQQYVNFVEAHGLTNINGTAYEIAAGHQIATDVYYGVRTPVEEQRYWYSVTPSSITRADANVLVNGALLIYLGIPFPSASNGVDT